MRGPGSRPEREVEDTLPWCTVEYIQSNEWASGEMQLEGFGSARLRGDMLLVVRDEQGEWCFWWLYSERLHWHRPNRPGQGGW